MYALFLPHHEVLIHAPATRANGWTHPIPLHHHPKATRRLTCTGMPTAERPAKRTHGSQAHSTTLKDEAHIGNPSLSNPTRLRSFSKITTRRFTLSPADGRAYSTPLAPTLFQTSPTSHTIRSRSISIAHRTRQTGPHGVRTAHAANAAQFKSIIYRRADHTAVTPPPSTAGSPHQPRSLSQRRARPPPTRARKHSANRAMPISASCHRATRGPRDATHPQVTGPRGVRVMPHIPKSSGHAGSA